MKSNRRKWSTPDIFLLFAVIALVCGVGCRIVIGRISGPDFTREATVDFDVSDDGKIAYGEMKAGDRLSLADDGSSFGRLDSLKEPQGGTIRIRGAVTESGFLLENGRYVSPYESYTLTDGYYTVTVTVNAVTVSETNG